MISLQSWAPTAKNSTTIGSFNELTCSLCVASINACTEGSHTVFKAHLSCFQKPKIDLLNSYEKFILIMAFALLGMCKTRKPGSRKEKYHQIN